MNPLGRGLRASLKPGASPDVLGVVRHHVLGERQDPSDPFVGHPVIPVSALPGGGHISTPAQTREMTRHPPLGDAENLHELGHGAFTLEE